MTFSNETRYAFRRLRTSLRGDIRHALRRIRRRWLPTREERRDSQVQRLYQKAMIARRGINIAIDVQGKVSWTWGSSCGPITINRDAPSPMPSTHVTNPTNGVAVFKMTASDLVAFGL